MRIVFLCSEYEGLIKTGGLADATRGLAQALVEAGHQVTVVMPRYGSLYPIPVEPYAQSLYFQLGEQTYGCAVRHMQLEGISIALIEHHDFFQRPRPYDDGEHGYADNALRFAFFCQAALQYIATLPEPPQIIHGHDWQTALAAPYLRHLQQRGLLKQSRFVFSIHNAAYQQHIAWHDLAMLGLSERDVASGQPLSLLAIGLYQATLINTVSQGYREELLTEPAANGLSALYQSRQHDFVGILNGCDYQRWDPSTDPWLIHHYNYQQLSGKQLCKQYLLDYVGWNKADTPLFVAVSRITSQKGFTLLIPALQQWLPTTHARVVLMGTGERQFITPLEGLMADFPAQFHFIEGFNEPLSHQLEAAGDFFLMPSLFEPCGLNQIYSLRYGAVPIVRATGGLTDTVMPYPEPDATGIRFQRPQVDALVAALQTAEQLYRRPEDYHAIQQRGMQQVFSWQSAAAEYIGFYQSLQKRDGAELSR